MSSQISKIPENSDIITITSGGNDLGYVAGFMGVGGGSPSVSETELTARFNNALTKIHSLAPRAKVYLVEYLTLLGPDARPNSNTVPLNSSRIEHQRGIAATLQRATAKAAQGKPWVEDIPVAEASRDHGIGSSQPWANGKTVLVDGVAWHPNSGTC
jgi:hypothetical protein